MAKTRGKAKAKTKAGTRMPGKRTRAAKAKAKPEAAPTPSSDTVRYTWHSRWTRWTKRGSRWSAKPVHETDVPDGHKSGIKMMAVAAVQIPCSDTVHYVLQPGGWVRRTTQDGYTTSDPVNEEDVPDNCK